MDREQKIVEDGPQMRSMQVMSAVPLIPRYVEPLAKAAPIRAGTAKPVVKGSAEWKLSEGDVMPLPSIYMLERTHVKINASVNEVAKRIAQCLQRESIFATYSSQEVSVRTPFGHDLFSPILFSQIRSLLDCSTGPCGSGNSRKRSLYDPVMEGSQR
jgi:hypothetical protein